MDLLLYGEFEKSLDSLPICLAVPKTNDAPGWRIGGILE